MNINNKNSRTRPDYVSDALLDSTIRQALTEDVGPGDITTRLTVDENLRWSGLFIARADGILAGLEFARRTFLLLENSAGFVANKSDGDAVRSGTIIAEVTARARTLLTGERVALNFLQRMSGIATLTRRYVQEVSGTEAVILDTRKTAPGLRAADKWAVKLGGGRNHRFGLFDMILIKENHISAAGGVKAALDRARSNADRNIPIEIEVQNMRELEETLSIGADRILLDNMPVAQIGRAVKRVEGKIPLEASGNISLQNVREVAETGVDYISVGKLTHSVKALDISFLLKKQKTAVR